MDILLNNYFKNQSGKNAEQIEKEKQEINNLLFKQFVLVKSSINKALKKYG